MVVLAKLALAALCLALWLSFLRTCAYLCFASLAAQHYSSLLAGGDEQPQTVHICAAGDITVLGAYEPRQEMEDGVPIYTNEHGLSAYRDMVSVRMWSACTSNVACYRRDIGTSAIFEMGRRSHTSGACTKKSALEDDRLPP
jgi:hypothetical protein